MKILVLNCGSSSLKYQFIDMKDELVLASGLCERISIDGKLKHKNNIKSTELILDTTLKNHTDAIKLVIDTLLGNEYGVISNISEVEAVGHRVVHGGEYFSKSVIITDDVLKKIEECCSLAPLHNPANLLGIYACKELMPKVSQVAVFDTAFHQTIPSKAFMYALPYEFYEKYKIRKYGFHGTSHKYVSLKACEVLGKDISSTKIISCHLGNGASVCAIDGGKSVDTSMGFTPLEGLIMGTRSGDIDPAITSFLIDKLKISHEKMQEILNKESGVLGIFGKSSDFRDIEKSSEEGDQRANLALEMFRYRVAQYIGKYIVSLNGVDAIIFTAGVGENSSTNREAICKYLTWLGIEIDHEQNSKRGEDTIISTSESKVKVLCIPTNEELMIARDTKELLDI